MLLALGLGHRAQRVRAVVAPLVAAGGVGEWAVGRGGVRERLVGHDRDIGRGAVRDRTVSEGDVVGPRVEGRDVAGGPVRRPHVGGRGVHRPVDEGGVGLRRACIVVVTERWQTRQSDQSHEAVTKRTHLASFSRSGAFRMKEPRHECGREARSNQYQVAVTPKLIWVKSKSSYEW